MVKSISKKLPWAVETLSLVASVIFVGALATMLWLFDGAAIWDYHSITLNTVVAILSTAAKAAILVAVSNCIGQWKWILFSGEARRLLDFERIDQATRGPMGSVRLLFSPKIIQANTVRLGALIMVLGIAIDPFSQQLVQFRQEVKFIPGENNEASSITRAERYSKGNEFFTSAVGTDIENGEIGSIGMTLAFADADFSLQAATVFGMSESESRISQQVNFKCQSNQCRYPKFKSLAICSRCEDITSLLEQNTDSSGMQYLKFASGNTAARAGENETEFRLPNGLFINNLRDEGWFQLVYMTMAGTTRSDRTVTMGDVDTLIWSQSLIRLRVTEENENNLWPDFPIEAAECALYYCVKEYTSEVRNGTLVESATETDEKRNPTSWDIQNMDAFGDEPVELSESFQKSIGFDKIQSFARRSDLQLGDGFNLSQAAVDGIGSFLQDTLGPCLNLTGDCDFATNPVNGYLVAEGLLLSDRSLQYEPAAARVLFEADDVATVWAGVARSMTNALRNGADADAEGAAVVRGRVGVVTTVYDVDWRWILLHGLMEAAAVLFLGVTVWASSARSRVPVPAWKSSSLAVLAKGPDTRGQLIETAMDTQDLEMSARIMSVTAADRKHPIDTTQS